MPIGTYKYTVVQDEKTKAYHHVGYTTKRRSGRGFPNKAALTNHVRALCVEMNLKAKEMKRAK